MSTIEELEKELDKALGKLAAIESQVGRGYLSPEGIAVAVAVPMKAEGDGITDEELHMIRKLWGV